MMCIMVGYDLLNLSYWNSPSGCAKGAFVQSMAKEFPERNFLGLEIRRPVAALGLSRAMALGLKNCHLVCCNVNVSRPHEDTQKKFH